MEVLRAKGLVYEGVLERPKSLDPHDEWEPVELTLFRSTQFGDDQDRPMKKSDGSWTYFGSDAAYHWQKAQDADHLVNIWGADHAGHGQARAGGGQRADRRPRRPRRQAGPDGAAVPRRRAGQDVASAPATSSPSPTSSNEVGKDVVRFMMLTKRADTPLDFDFAKVVEASKDNPVFYVQYAHARISSLKRKAADAGVDLRCKPTCRCSTMRSWRWSSAPRNIRACSKARRWRTSRTGSLSISTTWRPSSMRLWNRGNDDPERRFLLENNPQLSRARLELALGIAQIIRSGLGLMGVAATEEMR